MFKILQTIIVITLCLTLVDCKSRNSQTPGPPYGMTPDEESPKEQTDEPEIPEVPWDQAKEEDFLLLCINQLSLDLNFQNKAKGCQCILPTVKQAYSYDDYIKSQAAANKVLKSDPATPSCQKLAKFDQWPENGLKVFETQCGERYTESYNLAEDEWRPLCDCLLDHAAQTWEFSDYLKNQTRYQKKQEDDGEVTACLKKLNMPPLEQVVLKTGPPKESASAYAEGTFRGTNRKDGGYAVLYAKDRQILLFTLNASGNWPEDPFTLHESEAGSKLSQPTIAESATGNLFMVWKVITPDLGVEIWGAIWNQTLIAAPKRLDTAEGSIPFKGYDPVATSRDVSSGNPILAFSKSNGGMLAFTLAPQDRRAHLYTMPLSNSSFGTASAMAEIDGVQEVSLGAGDRRFFLAFVSLTSTLEFVNLLVTTKTDGPWSDLVMMEDEYGRNPLLSANSSDEALLVYDQSSKTQKNFRFNYAQYQKKWSLPQNLHTANNPINDPATGLGDDGVGIILWKSKGSSGDVIHSRVYKRQLNSWQATQVMSSQKPFQQLLQVSTAATGFALAAWSSQSSLNAAESTLEVAYFNQTNHRWSKPHSVLITNQPLEALIPINAGALKGSSVISKTRGSSRFSSLVIQ